MSLGSLLSIARSALIVSQRSMEVTGHNVANANTPGYSRQSLQIAASNPVQLGSLFVGTGVQADLVTRARDAFYDATFRQENGLLGQSSTTNGYLGQVEGALNEPSTNGLSSALDKLFGSLSDLAGDPANKTFRTVVTSNANLMVSQFHSLDSQLNALAAAAHSSMQTQVAQVNALAKQIADANNQIVAEGGAHAAPDLLDQRDQLIDQLSQYMNVRVLQRDDGSVGVAAGDAMLVDGSQSTALAVSVTGSGWGLTPAGGGPAISAGSGSLQALADFTQTKLPGVRAQLDQMAGALVTAFNQVHRTGTTLGGTTNVDFFDPAGVTAGTISLSAAIQASTDNIAASATGAPGNGDIATQLAGLRTSGVAALGGVSVREFFISLATGVGLDVSNTKSDTDAQQALVDRSDQARSAVSGVNVDEEMVALISEQQAYQAAARLVSVADQMMQSLLQTT